MARPVKEGLPYFPMDVDFFEDDKIAFVKSKYGLKGENIAIRLLCRIYRDKGYYTDWNDDTALLFSTRVADGVSYSLANDIVKELLRRSFFDKALFERFGVLTSRGIQKRYLRASSDAGRTRFKINPDFCLLEENEGFLPENPPFPPRKPPVSSEFSTQSKVKKIKVNENKINESDARAQDDFSISETEIKTLFAGMGQPEDMAFLFIDYYKARGCKTKAGEPISDWKAMVSAWVRRESKFKKGDDQGKLYTYAELEVREAKEKINVWKLYDPVDIDGKMFYAPIDDVKAGKYKAWKPLQKNVQPSLQTVPQKTEYPEGWLLDGLNNSDRHKP